MGIAARFAIALLTVGVLGCSADGIAGGRSLPPDVADPASVQTPAGALAFYRYVVASFGRPVEEMSIEAGVFTDELAALPLPEVASGRFTEVDSRHNVVFASTSTAAVPDANYYGQFHGLRAQAREARGFLTTYAADSSPSLRAHLYAIEGYAEIILADLYCSGIPLSTVDFGGDYTLAAGSTTAEVYAHAAMLLDSAENLANDSARVRHFAAIGRGRALLALGRYADAATAVSGVPDDYTYQIDLEDVSKTLLGSFVTYFDLTPFRGAPSVADREGLNGLDYRSSGDPRTPVAALGQDVDGHTMYFPAKYPQSGPMSFVIADGIEARLIEAEAAFQAGSSDWLTRLNALRTDGTFDTQPNPQDTTQTDTLWHAGTGRVPGLRPLNDPGTDELRVDLIFRERAFWLYLTGHRQGDLRRLIREYGREPDSVYPTGSYPGRDGLYGTTMVLSVPDAERNYNSKYAGCFHYDA